MKRIFYYIIIPIALYVIFIGFLFFKVYGNLKDAIESSLMVTQGLAIIIGGLWAYHKFGWEKKCENIISLKAALMEFSFKHNLSASQYHVDKDIVGYKTRLFTPYKNLSSKIHLSYYVSSKLRKKIFETTWLTIGNDTGKDNERIEENWGRFEKQLKEIYDEFDKVISL